MSADKIIHIIIQFCRFRYDFDFLICKPEDRNITGIITGRIQHDLYARANFGTDI